ncbi:MAG: PulJ/GspJ family protein, partial [Gammaproteobacteria bacterium]
MRRTQTEAGFTLIEVLLAMTLLGVMMALLFASLKISAESWEKSENRVSDISEIAATVNFFQRHLVDARPLWNDFNKEEKLFSFQGSKQSLQFVSAFPASAARAGLQLFSMQLVNIDGEQAVKVTLTPFYPPPEGEEWLKEEEILIGRVENFTLAYFGREKDESD